MSFPAPPTREFIRTVTPSDRAPTRLARIPHFFSLERDDTLDNTLKRPYNIFVEINGNKGLEALLDNLLSESPDTIISITTHSCYKHNVALSATTMLVERLAIRQDKEIQIATCLQEAIMNALLHGNLAVQGKFNTLEGFNLYREEIERKLEQEEYRNKRINISIWDGHSHLKIAVNDEGGGFSINTNTSDENRPHGRGLTFIKEMSEHAWVGDDNRTLFMTFAINN